MPVGMPPSDIDGRPLELPLVDPLLEPPLVDPLVDPPLVDPLVEPPLVEPDPPLLPDDPPELLPLPEPDDELEHPAATAAASRGVPMRTERMRGARMFMRVIVRTKQLSCRQQTLSKAAQKPLPLGMIGPRREGPLRLQWPRCGFDGRGAAS